MSSNSKQLEKWRKGQTGILLCFMCVLEAKEKKSDVFTVLTQYLDNHDIDATVSFVFHVGMSDKT